MNAALQLLPAPTPRSQIRRIVGNRRAWLASDARIPAVVLRQILQPGFPRAFPPLRPGPLRKRAPLEQRLAARQPVMFNLFQIFPRRRLLAAKSRKPNLEWLE